MKPFIDSIDSRNRLLFLPFAPAGRLIFSAAAEKMSSSKGPRPDREAQEEAGRRAPFLLLLFFGRAKKSREKNAKMSKYYTKMVLSLIKLIASRLAAGLSSVFWLLPFDFCFLYIGSRVPGAISDNG
ncbi:MAG: hypothetical protein K9K88_06020 [Desulfobacterales bacterium]|nr:hypothetical protein [Desulfobacterales bacterium]